MLCGGVYAAAISAVLVSYPASTPPIPSMVDVFYPGLMPKEQTIGMEVCVCGQLGN